MREDRGGPRRFGLAYEAGVFFYHAAWLHGFGGAIVPPGASRPVLDTREELEALRFLQGLSVAETADVMGRTEGAIKQLQLRAVRALAKLLPPAAAFR